MRPHPERRLMRWMTAGAYTVRHWRGILLSIWLTTIALFALIAWWGYANRDDGFGVFVFTIFAFLTLAMILRFPRRLLRSFRNQRGRRTTSRGIDSVVDTDAIVRPRSRRETPSLGSRGPAKRRP